MQAGRFLSLILHAGFFVWIEAASFAFFPEPRAPDEVPIVAAIVREKPPPPPPPVGFNTFHFAELLETLSDEDGTAPEEVEQQLSMDEAEIFKLQMQRCWSVPAGAAHAHERIVRIRVHLNTDGRLLLPPEIVEGGGGADSFQRTAAESALRAIRRCQPFEMPPEKYELWKEITLTFNPAEMLGG